MQTEQYMKRKTDIMVFKIEKSATVNCVELNSLKPTDECRYLGVIVDKELTYQKPPKYLINQMVLAIRSIYLLRNQKF